MPTPDLHPEAIRLINPMTGSNPSHLRFASEPINLTLIDALALGDLWTIAHATERWEDQRPIQSLAADTARAVLSLWREREPVFRGSACRDYLNLLARKVEEIGPDVSNVLAFSPWSEARFALARCIDLSFDGLSVAAKRFLAATPCQIAFVPIDPGIQA